MREIEENKTYRHFKGNVYKVLFIGNDSEKTDENGNPVKVVIYKSNHDGKIWVRPYDNFISKVDKEKYPNINQAEYAIKLFVINSDLSGFTNDNKESIDIDMTFIYLV